ncbi:MAG: DUF1800 family protein, partial [Rubricella sp.]
MPLDAFVRHLDIQSAPVLVIGRHLPNEGGGGRIARFGAALGQNLMAPPNVKGWPGGRHWITAHTLLLRRKGLERAVRSPELRKRFKGGEEAVAK